MGIKRLHSYVTKYFSEIHELGDMIGILEKLPQQAIYLVDATNLVNQQLSTQRSGYACIWDALVPFMTTIAVQGLERILKASDYRDGIAFTGKLNIIILFYDQNGKGKGCCESFLSDMRKKWAHAYRTSSSEHASELNKFRYSNTFHVSVCENSADSADRLIFLRHQIIRKETKLPVIIISNDSDMLVYSLQNIQSSLVTTLRVFPIEQSLFMKRSSSKNALNGQRLNFSLLSSKQIERKISAKFIPSFVFHILSLLGTSSESKHNFSCKRTRSNQKCMNGFSGILSYHANDITVYKTLYDSWQFLIGKMKSESNENGNGNFLVHQTKISIIINLIILRDFLVNIGPSVFQGSNAEKNAEDYLRAVASTLLYYSKGINLLHPKVSEIDVPSLTAICCLMKRKASFKSLGPRDFKRMEYEFLYNENTF